MAKPPRPTYIPTPPVAPAVRARYQVVLEVLAGTRSVSAGARQLGLSRMHFQMLLHRGLQGLLTELAPKPPGRPKTASTERGLRKEAERLRRENAKLQARVQTTDRLLAVASGLLQGRLRASGRAARPRKAAAPKARSREAGEEAEGPCAERLAGVQALRRLVMRAALAARIMGVSVATVTRWTAQLRRPRAQADPAPSPGRADGGAPQVRALVRQTRGLIGAEALRRSVPGVSRRRAAWIKRETLTAMERERVAAAERITITMPGVLRGFDAMHVHRRYLLVAGDGCVPYRTSLTVSAAYDARAVVRALERDLASFCRRTRFRQGLCGFSHRGVA